MKTHLIRTLILSLTFTAFASCRDESDVDPYFSASEADIELQANGLSSDGQPGEFSLGANESWTVTDKPEWVSINHLGGDRGRFTMYVTATQNPTADDRRGYIELELANGKPEQVSVFQHHVAEALSVSKTSISADILGRESGAAPLLKVKSNYAWTLTPAQDASWIKPSLTEGEAGEADITLHIEANDTKAPRTGMLTFASGHKSIEITVSQDATAFTSVSTSTISFSKAGDVTDKGDRAELTFHALEPWSVTANPDWLTLTPKEGQAGAATLSLKATPNTTGADRTGTVTITSAHGVKQTLAVSQTASGTKPLDEESVGHVYFEESFEWAHTYALSHAGECQDQVGSVDGSEGKSVRLDKDKTLSTEFEKRLFAVNASSNPIYVCDGYIKIGRGNTQGGVILKPLSIQSGHSANVEVSFSMADNKTDKTTIVVEIKGDGQIADGQNGSLSELFTPIRNTDNDKAWQWSKGAVKITGVTKDTQIIIRSSQQNTKGYYRWFLDNIKVTRTK